jgi:FlaG/FlaF family flagellin (archaellin)
MKGISTIVATILIVIIVVALVSLTYTFATGLLGTTTAGATQATQAVTERLQKTVAFAAVNCAGNPNEVKFTLQHTGTVNINVGELAAFLNGSKIDFTNTTGSKITDTSLKAGTISDEFNYTATDTKNSRIITVSTPAGSIDKAVTCTS